VWKFKHQEEFFVDVPKGEKLKVSKHTQYTADLALFSFLKIIAKINKFSHILDYRNNQALNERMPGYKVKMGFGLHFGWAIEGAIGSMFKIDASYLSPNVNMASRLEAATKQYGVCLLASGAIHDIFSDEIKKICREVDTVTVKGSLIPVRLFTVDIDFENLGEKQDRLHGLSLDAKKKIRDQEKKDLLGKIERGTSNTWDLFSTDKDFKEMRKNYDKYFVKRFNDGYQKYIKGDWATAEDMFAQCLRMNPKDGPTMTLKAYIEELNGRPPLHWDGFRELTEK
jgi:hypothetical protein